MKRGFYSCGIVRALETEILVMAENYCTSREASKLLGISVRTAQLWVENGTLEGWKTKGGHRRITRRSIMQILHDRSQVSAAAWPVLIIEDDAALLKLYRLQLSRWPFAVNVYTAPNGYEGLLMVGEMGPRLLICDLRMPGVSGFQIVRALNNMERYKKMAIVVVSGLPLNEIDAHGGLPVNVEIMGKPIDFARLEKIAAGLNHGFDSEAFVPAESFA